MIREVSAILERAIDREEAPDLVARLDRIAHENSLSLEWDIDAGEQWARLLFESSIVALVHTYAQLAIVRPDVVVPTVFAEYFDDVNYQVVAVADFELPLLSARPELVERLAGRSLSSSFDSERFSVTDLWFATS